MTREEAVKFAEHAVNMTDIPEVKEFYRMAAAALTLPTQEQVEKVWRGEWMGDDDEKVGTIDGSPIKSATCSKCGNWLVGSDEYECSGYFCPFCGAPMTDEAVGMVMERLEEFHGQENP